jgi:hypothetical protein
MPICEAERTPPYQHSQRRRLVCAHRVQRFSTCNVLIILQVVSRALATAPPADCIQETLNISHVPPDDRRIPRFFAVRSISSAALVLEVTVRQTPNDWFRAFTRFVERRGEAVRLDNHLMDKSAERLARCFLNNHGGGNVVDVRIIIAIVDRQFIGIAWIYGVR